MNNAGLNGGYQRKGQPLGEWRRGLPKLTQEQQAEVIVDYIAGMKLKAIGEKYGLHPSSVCQLMARKGVKLREPKALRDAKAKAASEGSRYSRLTPAQRAALVADYKAGLMSVPEIANKYDLSTPDVPRVVKAAGLVVRRGRR